MIYQGKTLPSLQSGLSHPDTVPVLRMTVVFHPDLARIGQYVDLCPWDVRQPERLPGAIVVGRLSPILSDGQPLGDPHISRQAFTAQPKAIDQPGAYPGLRVEVCGDADVRIGREQHSRLIADNERLEQGIAIRLGHAVVIILRRVDANTFGDYEGSGRLADYLPGASPAMQALRRQVAAVAPTPLPVLLLGESGVGKERAARAVHALSQRATGALETINLAAVPEGLAAAELFGSVRGGFTGATARDGAFRRANGGTLFLDEIADAPLAVQVQLLRALEQGEIQVVGGTVQRVDVRIIAATDQDLSHASGFREALRNRIAGFTLTLPPLRERPEDVAPQALAMLLSEVDLPEAVHPEQSQEQPMVAAKWARFFFAAAHREWPGNARELRHALAAVACDEPSVTPLVTPTPRDKVDPSGASPSDEDLLRVYAAQGYEVSATAALLGLSRPALYRRLQAHPACRLVEDLTDEQIERAISRAESVREAAMDLRVSVHALRPRLRRLGRE